MGVLVRLAMNTSSLKSVVQDDSFSLRKPDVYMAAKMPQSFRWDTSSQLDCQLCFIEGRLLCHSLNWIDTVQVEVPKRLT